MSEDTERARAMIRSGEIQCPCRQFMLSGHRRDCLWIAAVEFIYEQERKEEKERG